MELENGENYATWLTNLVKDEYDNETRAAKNTGHAIKVECATGFGILTIIWMQGGRNNLIRMEVLQADKSRSLIITRAEQCSFMLSRFTPNEKEKEIGFTVGDRQQPTDR